MFVSSFFKHWLNAEDLISKIATQEKDVPIEKKIEKAASQIFPMLGRDLPKETPLSAKWLSENHPDLLLLFDPLDPTLSQNLFESPSPEQPSDLYSLEKKIHDALKNIPLEHLQNDLGESFYLESIAPSVSSELETLDRKSRRELGPHLTALYVIKRIQELPPSEQVAITKIIAKNSDDLGFVLCLTHLLFSPDTKTDLLNFYLENGPQNTFLFFLNDNRISSQDKNYFVLKMLEKGVNYELFSRLCDNINSYKLSVETEEKIIDYGLKKGLPFSDALTLNANKFQVDEPLRLKAALAAPGSLMWKVIHNCKFSEESKAEAAYLLLSCRFNGAEISGELGEGCLLLLLEKIIQEKDASKVKHCVFPIKEKEKKEMYATRIVKLLCESLLLHKKCVTVEEFLSSWEISLPGWILMSDFDDLETKFSKFEQAGFPLGKIQEKIRTLTNTYLSHLLLFNLQSIVFFLVQGDLKDQWPLYFDLLSELIDFERDPSFFSGYILKVLEDIETKVPPYTIDKYSRKQLGHSLVGRWLARQSLKESDLQEILQIQNAVYKDKLKTRVVIRSLFRITFSSLKNKEKLIPLFLKGGKQLYKISCAIETLFLLKQEKLLEDETLSTAEKIEGLICTLFRKNLDLSRIKDFEKEYGDFVETARHPVALAFYMGKILSLNNPALTKSFETLVEAQFTHNYPSIRYQKEKSPHLEHISHSPAYQMWQEEKKASFKALTQDVPLDETTLIDFKKKIAEKCSDGHLKKVDFPALFDFIGDAPLSAEASPFESGLIKLSQTQEPSTQKQLLQEIKKEALKLPKESVQLFLHDLEGFEKILSSKLIDEEKYQLVDTDDFQDLLLCGYEVYGSCQSFEGDPLYNQCLLNYLLDGKCRIILVRDINSGKMVARAIIRWMVDSKTMTPILLMERIYSQSEDKKILVALTKMAYNRSEALKAPLLIRDPIALPNFKIENFEAEAQSLGSVAPLEYFDSAEILDKRIPDGKINLSGLFKVDLLRI